MSAAEGEKFAYGRLPTASHEFPSTHWSLVGLAGATGEHVRHQALGELLNRYLAPMRAHTRRRWNVSEHAAEDLLQSFLTDKVLEQNLIAEADQARGRFRSFLLTALDHFVSNQFRRGSAKKRAPERLTDIDGVDEPLPPPNSDIFDVAWAREVLAQTVDLMRSECMAAGRGAIWGVFEARTLIPTLNNEPPETYAELIRRFGFATPAQASNALVTANRMFARLLRVVIGRYELDEQAIDEEIRDLMRILASAGAQADGCSGVSICNVRGSP